ncbi:MAG: hypothetical protein GWN94_17315 [Phycisphaerae bacterium]|nr:hypothetical protein [Phycisphaerae bacterium]
MNPVLIVIPTIMPQQARRTRDLALITARCKARVIISHDKNGDGFTKTCNRGMEQAKDTEDICLLNDDIIWFQHGWLNILERALHTRPNFGMVCPGGNSSTAPMRDARIGEKGLEMVNHIPFWCVLFKRKMLNKQGLMDEEFIHYASDNWYCDLASRAGWKMVWVKDVFLKHRQHGSGMKNEWRLHDQEVYARKHSRRRR